MKKIISALSALFLLLPVFTFAATAADYEAYARQQAEENGVNADHLVATLRCEAHFKASAIGDGGESFGLAQIHLPDHPEITPKQALNGYWAIDWTVQAFLHDKASMWSCWSKYYG